MPALLIKSDPKQPSRRIIFSGSTQVGSIYETDRSMPEMRFKWVSANDHYGYAESIASALKELSAKVPGVIAEAERIALDSAAFAALPDHIQDLVINERRAHFEFLREERRTVVNEVKLSVAKGAWDHARAALAAAQVELGVTAKAA